MPARLKSQGLENARINPHVETGDQIPPSEAAPVESGAKPVPREAPPVMPPCRKLVLSHGLVARRAVHCHRLP